MPDILLKNALGEDVRYNGVERVLLTEADTGERIPYTYGDGGAADIAVLLDYNAQGSLRLESSCYQLRYYAFYMCKSVAQVRLPETVLLGLKPFYGADNLEAVFAPKAISVPDECFYYCDKLTEVVVPQAKTVGRSAFEGCTALKKLELGPVTSIDRYALMSSGVTSLVISGETVCTLGTSALSGTPISRGTGYIYVPESLVEAYKAASGWSTYAGQIRAIGNG